MGKRSLPSTTGKRDGYLIVCEGPEENDYIESLRHCDVWKKGLAVRTVVANGISRIEDTFYDACGNDHYENIVVFCDTETDLSDFERLWNGIGRFIKKAGWDVGVENVVFFSNPNTMQIILLHFDSKKPVRLKTNKKNKNKAQVNKLTGVEGYEARGGQRKDLFDKINADNYKTMRSRLKSITTDDYKQLNGTNVARLFDALE